MSNRKKMVLNLVCSIASFFTNLLINFVLSPYIVRTIGIEANGFISLGNNFITYISLITTAFSSMTARFVTVSMYKKEEEESKKYYSSSIMANIMVVLMLLIPAILLIHNLEFIIKIPQNLIFDVKLLFSLLIINFMINSLFSCFSVSYFTKDSLYLQNIVTLIGYLIRLVSVLVLFIVFKPNVYYIGLAALIVIIYTSIVNLIIKNRIMNNIKFDLKSVKFSYIATLFKSGVWNSINTLGTILLTGLDLLIANVFLGSVAMGILALVKTITNVIFTLNNQVAQVFYPKNTILYAKHEYKSLVEELKKEMNILSILNSIPIALLIVFGKEFFGLWQPTQNSWNLYILCILSMYSLIFSGGMDVLWSIFTVTNKLKWNSLLVILSGIINIVAVILFVKYTNYGIYAIAGISPLINLLRNIFYTLPYSAKYINQNKNTFFYQIFRSFINVFIFVITGIIFGLIITKCSWLFLIIKCGFTFIIGLILNYVFTFSPEEKSKIKKLLKEL